MKRTYHFAGNIGYVACNLTGGGVVNLPVIPGILKHPMPDDLGELLMDDRIARKYTRVALEKTSWPVLKQFPHEWLLKCIDSAQLTESRKKAILYLIS